MRDWTKSPRDEFVYVEMMRDATMYIWRKKDLDS